MNVKGSDYDEDVKTEDEQELDENIVLERCGNEEDFGSSELLGCRRKGPTDVTQLQARLHSNSSDSMSREVAPLHVLPSRKSLQVRA